MIPPGTVAQLGCQVYHGGRYNGESMRRVSRMLMLRRQRRQGRIPSGTVRCRIRCDVPCRCIMHWCITGGVTSMGQWDVEGSVGAEGKGRWGGSSIIQSPQKGF